MATAAARKVWLVVALLVAGGFAYPQSDVDLTDDSGNVFTWREVAACSSQSLETSRQSSHLQSSRAQVTQITDEDLQQTLDALTDEQKKRWMVGIGMRNYIGVIDWRTDRTTGQVEKLQGSLPPGIAVPPIFMMDNGNGFRNDAGAPGMSTVFPPGAALGMTWDVEVVRDFGALLARLFKHRGSNLILGPGLTVMRTPFGSRNWEYISGEEPVLGGVLGAAFAQGAKSENVLTQAKHWVNNHQELDRMQMVASMDIETQMEVHLKPFEYYLRYGRGSSVMCGYNRVHLWEKHEEDDPPWECEESFMLRYAKRKYPHFWVGSDWWAVRHAAIDGTQLLSRGMDQELPGNADGSGDALTAQVLDSQLENVNASVLRFLRALRGHGMLSRQAWPDSWAGKHEAGSDEEAYQAFSSHNGNAQPFSADLLKEGAAVARSAVLHSAVLLRNAHDLLPLQSRKLSTHAAQNVPGVAPGSERIGLFGCDPTPTSGAVDWSGFFISGGGSGAVTWDRSSGQVKSLDDAEAGLPSVLTEDGRVFHVAHGAAVQADSCDIAIVCYSAYAAEEFAMPNRGDRTTLRLHTMWGSRKDQVGYCGKPTQVDQAGCKKSIAVVSAPGHVSGTLLKGSEGLGDFDALAFTVFPGEQFGPALTDLLYARDGAGFSGKLSVALPHTDEDLKHFETHAGTTRYTERGAIGHRWMQVHKIPPAYQFGSGLAYTPMALDGLPEWVAPPCTAEQDCLWAFKQVCVRNVGARFVGSEVVQFYFQRRGRRRDQTYLELAHFVKLRGIAPLRTLCVEETKFAPPQRWDASRQDLVDLHPAELRMFVSTQGVGFARFGASSASAVRNAGANNSVAPHVQWEALELQLVADA